LAGATPDFTRGAYSAPSNLAGFKGPTSKERGGKGKGEGGHAWKFFTNISSCIIISSQWQHGYPSLM